MMQNILLFFFAFDDFIWRLLLLLLHELFAQNSATSDTQQLEDV